MKATGSHTPFASSLRRTVLAMSVAACLALASGCSDAVWEELDAPRVVIGTADDGTLHFDDGTSLHVPKLGALHRWPEVRDTLLHNGVEIDAWGRAWVALDVRSFCGNDTRGDERRRVPLELLLAFLTDPDLPRLEGAQPVAVHDHALVVSDWLAFERWCRTP